ncbi:hypothetical protein PoB_002135400 [Plakobranchus ocellatus]|uniref:Uncharacterized protein n=1 Tax=Plakobranchus ocellatus TaxID=259542 RepID=A0AAV3ZKF3_9GAST|nr:hypothetical protein PoB_002135400 [Plakobranchus ocellatus]
MVRDRTSNRFYELLPNLRSTTIKEKTKHRGNKIVFESVDSACATHGSPSAGEMVAQGVGGTVDSESTLRSAGIFLLQVRAPPLAP